MAHAQKPDFVSRRNGRVHLNRPGGVSSVDCWHSRGLRISGSNAGYTVFRGSVRGTGYPLHSPVSPLHFPSRVSPCAITFQLDSTVLATHCIRQFPLHYSSLVSPCAITFQLDSTVLATHCIRHFSLHFPFLASQCAITFQLDSTVLAIHSIRQFPLHFPSRASPCAITFQPNCTLDTS
jgi:hypothetical protein